MVLPRHVDEAEPGDAAVLREAGVAVLDVGEACDALATRFVSYRRDNKAAPIGARLAVRDRTQPVHSARVRQ